MKHFELYELVDRETFEKEGMAALTHFNNEALLALDDLREFLGVPCTINNWHSGGNRQWCGLRTPKCTIGVKFSQHRIGNAFDVHPAGMTAEEARQKILADKDNPLVSRITRLEAGVSWVHFDLMPVPDRIHLFRA